MYVQRATDTTPKKSEKKSQNWWKSRFLGLFFKLNEYIQAFIFEYVSVVSCGIGTPKKSVKKRKIMTEKLKNQKNFQNS
jgi:hypothetical protein